MSRTQNSLRNIAFGLTGQILNIIMSFAMRTVFIHTLSDIYLGINGTFTDILMLFSLADLGVGTAIVYALYKPVAEQDKNKIKALMKLYGYSHSRHNSLVFCGVFHKSLTRSDDAGSCANYFSSLCD